jgi:hypothetical protein
MMKENFTELRVGAGIRKKFIPDPGKIAPHLISRIPISMKDTV